MANQLIGVAVGMALRRVPTTPGGNAMSFARQPDAEFEAAAKNPALIAASLSELWFPKVIGELDDSYIKVAKLWGSLTWHSHDHEDEMFFVLSGRLRIEMPDFLVELGEGELYVVPRGVRHNPVAEEECLVLLVERKSTSHTGNVRISKTRSILEQLAPPGQDSCARKSTQCRSSD